MIVLLNSDVEAAPGWLAAILSAFERDAQTGMVASKIMLFDRREVFNSAGDEFGRDGIPRNRGVWEEDMGQYDRSEYVLGPCGGAAAYRRAVLLDAGLFDERLFMYLEDVDMAWRAQMLGYRCLYEPGAVVYHRLSATGGGALSSYYTGRNTVAVLLKNLPMALLRRHWRAILGPRARWRWRPSGPGGATRLARACAAWHPPAVQSGLTGERRRDSEAAAGSGRVPGKPTRLAPPAPT